MSWLRRRNLVLWLAAAYAAVGLGVHGAHACLQLHAHESHLEASPDQSHIALASIDAADHDCAACHLSSLTPTLDATSDPTGEPVPTAVVAAEPAPSCSAALVASPAPRGPPASSSR